MPGYQPQTPRWPKCSLCGGVDLGNFGVIAHRRDCPRNPCAVCHLTILPGEARASGLPVRHLDCDIDLREHLDTEHYEDTRA